MSKIKKKIVLIVLDFTIYQSFLNLKIIKLQLLGKQNFILVLYNLDNDQERILSHYIFILQINMITKLLQNAVFSFSIRVKGPASFREKVKNNQIQQKKQIVQDFFKGYYIDTNDLYKNNFTEKELENSNEMVKRTFSLQNTTPRQLLKFRISQAVKKYQIGLNDHGSAAVQCASMSEKIILMMQHVKKYPKDTKAGRSLVKLIQKRRNMLDYLMRTDFHRYKWVCVDYGIPEIGPKNGHHKTDFTMYINSWSGY